MQNIFLNICASAHRVIERNMHCDIVTAKQLETPDDCLLVVGVVVKLAVVQTKLLKRS